MKKGVGAEKVNGVGGRLTTKARFCKERRHGRAGRLRAGNLPTPA